MFGAEIRDGISKAGLTRNVLVLSAERAVGVPGHGLIEAEIVPENRKLRRVRLTSKGRRFAEKVARTLEG